MSIFANESGELQGVKLMPHKVAFDINDPMTSFGHPVPMFRRAAAEKHMKSMGISSGETRMSIIGRMCDRIERDEPHGAMMVAKEALDVTGVYRLLSVLCAAADENE